MTSAIRLSRRLISGALLLAVVVLFLACEDDKEGMKPDISFSINVMTPPDFWPRPDKDFSSDPDRRKVQEDVLAEKGRPDALRIVWTPDRRIVRQVEMADMIDRKRGLTSKPEFEWIYTDRGVVVRFKKDAAEERPLDDRLRAICTYGDPHEYKHITDSTGQVIETFIYYDVGKMYQFKADDGKKVREDTIPATPGMKRRA